MNLLGIHKITVSQHETKYHSENKGESIELSPTRDVKRQEVISRRSENSCTGYHTRDLAGSNGQ